jgi:hypothetical protein
MAKSKADPNQVIIDGLTLPVTKGFWKSVLRPLNQKQFSSAELVARVRGLELASEHRQLTASEEDEKDRLVKVWVVGNANRLLFGRPLSDFGFEYADQVHVRHQRLHCGCQLTTIFDHHKADAEEDHVHHPHVPRRTCPAHPHGGDFKAHAEQALADHDARQAQIEKELAEAPAD